MCLEPTLIHKTNILFIILLTKVPEPSQLVIPLTNSVWLHHICTQLNISWKQELINIEVFFSITKSLHCSSTSSEVATSFLIFSVACLTFFHALVLSSLLLAALICLPIKCSHL